MKGLVVSESESGRWEKRRLVNLGCPFARSIILSLPIARNNFLPI